MSKNVLIVESPSKVKKIQSFLNSDYKVSSSKGHIRNINPKGLCIDVENDFKPEYIVTPDKIAVVSQLKHFIKKDTIVWLAADYDREGEAIAWHLNEVLKIKKENRRRIVFTEITKKAILKAIEKPTDIDMNMFYSQQARMILDKLIGYRVSPVLWNQFNNFKLSAGRVQSVVVKIVAEREQEISKFQSKSYFKTNANFWIEKPDSENIDVKSAPLKTTLEKDIEDYDVAKKLVDSLENGVFIVDSIKTSKTKRKPPPPFTTSTLQQEASVKLGMSPDTTMKCAQQLYENGLITYMRTDSLALADDALKSIASYIKSKYGDNYHNETKYKSKSQTSQEAHEACRPTNIEKTSVSGIEKLTNAHNRLYQLIWRRTVACQMKPADMEIKTVKINLENTKHVFVGKFEKVLFDGYLAVYKKTDINPDENTEDDSTKDGKEKDKAQSLSKSMEAIIKKMKKGNNVYIATCDILEKNSKPPQARFTEASLIKKLDELGVGRPSTYASMVNKVQERQYIERTTKQPVEKIFTNLTFTFPNKVDEKEKKMKVDGEKNKLFLTSLGEMINTYLNKNLENVMNIKFTAEVESWLDEVANGKKQWLSVVKAFYENFNPVVEKLLAIKGKSSSSNKKQNGGNDKVLGTHPVFNVPIVVYNSQYGPAICLKYDDPKKRRFANFKGDIDDMTFEEACKLLIYPKQVGSYNNENIYLNKGKSYYLSYKKKNYSLDIYCKNHREEVFEHSEIDAETAERVIKSYMDIEKEKVPDKVITPIISIKKGPYGFYIKYKGVTNIPLPRGKKDKALDLTDDEVKEIVDKFLEKKKNNKK